MEKLKVIDFWDFTVIDESPSFHLWTVENRIQTYFQFSVHLEDVSLGTLLDRM